jgi:hypothetical protein
MSLVAVLVALALGLLLGVTIGDKNLVSNFQGDLEQSLRSDVETARDNEDKARQDLKAQTEFVASTYPQLVSGTLTGESVATIGSADTAQLTIRSVGRAVAPTWITRRSCSPNRST